MTVAIQNGLRQIELVIYRLKRQFGISIQIKEEATQTQNLETGEITRTFISDTIRRAVVLPTRLMRDFIYDLSFIAANKNFTYGGHFDVNTRIVIFDKKDLDNISEISNDTLIIISNRRYMVKEVAETADSKSYLLIVTELKASANES